MSDHNESKNPYDKTVHTSKKTQRDTAILNEPSLLRRAGLPGGEALPNGTATLGDRREVILVIRGMIERVTVRENVEFKLGRFEPTARQANEIDLTPYGAMDRGVSRLHARIHLEKEHLYITDLGSTNGTFLAGVRLEKDVPTLLRKGDELILGRLPIQVMFR
ncbi:MAG: FHA domain-containing protein [Anaerolineae bacterium]|nr:FHA domain-containing protein [Anaerolineae bacterium]